MENNEIIEAKIESGHDKKSFAKSGVLGFFLGLAVIVPGISGSTIAILFKLYNHILYCLSNLFKKFIKCILFLIPLILGAIVGVGLGFVTIKQLLNILPFATVFLFVGLMSGAFPGVKDEIKDIKPTKKLWTLFAVGLVIPILISAGSYFLNNASSSTITPESIVSKFNFGYALLFLAIGYIVAITQVVPGLSATAILMAFGYFKPFVDSVSLSFWKSNPIIFAVYACLGVGFLLGLFTFSKFLTYLFKIAKASTLYTIVGLSLGSIISMIISTDMINVYTSWSAGGTMVVVDIVLGICMCAIGLIVGYALVKHERNHNTSLEKIDKNIGNKQ